MAAQVLEANERGGFDLSAAPTTPCAICATPRTSEELLAPSCQHPRHGACKKCMAMARAAPGRAAIDRDDGSMGQWPRAATGESRCGTCFLVLRTQKYKNKYSSA